ncbi:MAG: transposase [Candidatus Omnitrophica bacterium]|nr:transposase [Candidatus Omnitrophota bacterium]
MRVIKKWSASQRAMIVGGHSKSGMSVAEYCQEHGVHKSTFYTWLKKLPKPEKAPKKGFIKIKSLIASRSADLIRIETPQGYRIEVPQGSAADFIRRVIHSVRAQ